MDPIQQSAPSSSNETVEDLDSIALRIGKLTTEIKFRAAMLTMKHQSELKEERYQKELKAAKIDSALSILKQIKTDPNINLEDEIKKMEAEKQIADIAVFYSFVPEINFERDFEIDFMN